jgi:hypothetical protein
MVGGIVGFYVEFLATLCANVLKRESLTGVLKAAEARTYE